MIELIGAGSRYALTGDKKANQSVSKKKLIAEIFKTKNGQFAFRLVHSNGNILSSSETYTRKANATKSCKNLIETILHGNWELKDLTKKK